MPYTRNRTLGNLRKYSFTSNFDSSFTLRCKNAKNRKTRYASRRKKKISEISKFSILPYTRNRTLGNLRKYSFTSNFDSSFTLRCKNAKNRKTRYASRRKKKISEISKFSILQYTQNRKLGNLCKCSFQILAVVLI